jgi:hypothetical protein
MHSSGSIIKTYCEKVRHYLDDPDLDAKYDDNYLVRFFLSSAMTDVISRVSMMSDAQITSSFNISVTAGTSHYKLPPAVAQVLRIGSMSDQNGLFVEDYRPRNQFNPYGPNWSIEGNTIVFEPKVNYNRVLTVVFVPSGDVMCHYQASTTGTLNSNGTFTMPATATIGSLDKRPNSYQGAYLRIFGANVTDEVVISNYDAQLRVVTPSTAFVNAVGSYSYEIVPFLLEPMIDAISLSAAMRAGVGRKINQAHMQALGLAYKQAIKTAHDTLGNMNARVGKYFAGATIDRQEFYMGPTLPALVGGAFAGGTANCGCDDVASQTTLSQILLLVQNLQNDVNVISTGGMDGGLWGAP